MILGAQRACTPVNGLPPKQAVTSGFTVGSLPVCQAHAAPGAPMTFTEDDSGFTGVDRRLCHTQPTGPRRLATRGGSSRAILPRGLHGDPVKKPWLGRWCRTGFRYRNSVPSGNSVSVDFRLLIRLPSTALSLQRFLVLCTVSAFLLSARAGAKRDLKPPGAALCKDRLTYTRAHTCVHGTCAHTCTCLHVHIHVQAQVCARHTDTHRCTDCIHTRAHVYTHKHAHTCT